MTKTAKEMFEELGYELTINLDYKIIYEKQDIELNHIKYQIEFSDFHKGVIKHLLNSSHPSINIFEQTINGKEIKAINQQMLELGWLDE